MQLGSWSRNIGERRPAGRPGVCLARGRASDRDRCENTTGKTRATGGEPFRDDRAERRETHPPAARYGARARPETSGTAVGRTAPATARAAARTSRVRKRGVPAEAPRASSSSSRSRTRNSAGVSAETPRRRQPGAAAARGGDVSPESDAKVRLTPIDGKNRHRRRTPRERSSARGRCTFRCTGDVPPPGELGTAHRIEAQAHRSRLRGGSTGAPTRPCAEDLHRGGAAARPLPRHRRARRPGGRGGERRSGDWRPLLEGLVVQSYPPGFTPVGETRPAPIPRGAHACAPSVVASPA